MDKINIDIQQILLQALNIYHYGSLVYGTFVKNKSDFDFIVIIPDNLKIFDKQQSEYQRNQYNFFTQTTWQNKLDNNEIDAMEIFFLPSEFIIKETIKFDTKIHPQKIRNNFSKISSNSFVTCKKKLEIKESFNPRVAKKSLWHSLRIIHFGIQILSKGKIYNYSSMNNIYKEIVDCEIDEWEYYKNKYKPLYNNLKTQFRTYDKEVF